MTADGTSQTRIARLWFYAAFAGLGIGGVLITAGVWVGVGEYLPNIRWLAVLGLIPISGIRVVIVGIASPAEPPNRGNLLCQCSGVGNLGIRFWSSCHR